MKLQLESQWQDSPSVILLPVLLVHQCCVWASYTVELWSAIETCDSDCVLVGLSVTVLRILTDTNFIPKSEI